MKSPEERIAFLEDQGVTWPIDHVVRWEKYYALTQEYGPVILPFITSGGVKLGAWQGNQRFNRNSGKLRPDRERRLEAIPGWQWENKTGPKARADGAWEDKRQQLIEWVSAHGRMPLGKKEPLGRWVEVQRITYKRGQTPQERIDALEQVPGWVWSESTHRRVNQTK